MLIFQIALDVISVFVYLHIVRYEPSKACVRVYGLDFCICPRQIFHSLEYQNDDNSLKKQTNKKKQSFIQKYCQNPSETFKNLCIPCQRFEITNLVERDRQHFTLYEDQHCIHFLIRLREILSRSEPTSSCPRDEQTKVLGKRKLALFSTIMLGTPCNP